MTFILNWENINYKWKEFLTGGDGGGRYEGWVDDESDTTCGPRLVLWIFDFSKLESPES